ncbi:hypothetical protein N665_0180s0002 [Sinapis alba]|nr:hypothetical protein N665_0180s0002 [Sinapis alba]
MVEEVVGLDVWDELKESAVGVIIKLKKLDYTWSEKYVHYFLTNQLAIKRRHEIGLLIECLPIRFSLYEFGEITSLNCDPFDEHDEWDADHEEFLLKMSVPLSKIPKLNELQALFLICRNESREKPRMVGLLCVLSIGIFRISRNSRISLHCAKMVMDPAAFNCYPWGRIGFSSLVNSIKVLTYEGKDSYTLHGCVHALLIWIYDYVPSLGELYRHHIEDGSRKRINFCDFFAQEKNHLKATYPKWIDDKDDTDLDNMIADIINDQLNETFWDGFPRTKGLKRKPQSWMVQKKISVYSLPIQCVIKKNKKDKKKMVKKKEKKNEVPMKKVKMEKSFVIP